MSRLIVLLSLMMFHVVVVANTKQRVLDSFLVSGDSTNVSLSVQVVHSNTCKNDPHGGGEYCKLEMHLLQDGKLLSKQASWDIIYPEVNEKSLSFDLGSAYKGQAWSMGTEERDMSLGALQINLDAKNKAIVLKLSAQGADYYHHRYQIWGVLHSTKPYLKLLYEGGATNGPFRTSLELQNNKPDQPMQFSSLTTGFPEGTSGVNTFEYSVHSWNGKKSIFIQEATTSKKLSIPLYAAIIESFKTPTDAELAIARWGENKQCSINGETDYQYYAVYSTDDTLLNPGHFFIGYITTSHQDAINFVTKSRRCDKKLSPYVKRIY